MKGTVLTRPSCLTRLSILAVLGATACESTRKSGQPEGDLLPILDDLDGNANAVFAPTPDEIYVVGGRPGRGMILRYDGIEWVRTQGSGSKELHWIYGLGPDAMWAIGDEGTILHFDGNIWTPQFSGAPDATLYGLWARDESEVWAVGGGPSKVGTVGIVLRSDGDFWQPDPVSGLWAAGMQAVWGNDDGAWIVGRSTGGSAMVVRLFEGEWDRVSVGVDADLWSLHGSGNDTFAAGRSHDGFGTVLRTSDMTWFPVATLPEPLSGIVVSDDFTWVAGFSGFVARAPRSGEVEPDFTQVDSGTDRCFRTAYASDAWGLWLTGGACIDDSLSLGIVLHVGPPAVSGGPVRNLDRDAGIQPDGDIPDAGDVDAGLPGIPPGEQCPSGAGCQAGLQCWFVVAVNTFVCTRPCSAPSQCTDDFGTSCCERPGAQTGTTVCLPDTFGACD